MNHRLLLMAVPAIILAAVSCEKDPLSRRGNQAIKVTVDVASKASVQTTATLQDAGIFQMSAYATERWQVDSVGSSGYIDPGIYTVKGKSFKDIDVKYASGKWTIDGNGDESAPAFPWINKVTMNFFAYAPKAIYGTRTLKKQDTNYDGSYPFYYAAKATDGTVSSSECDDLLFAFTAHKASYVDDSTSPDFGKLIDGSSDKFNLTFHHAMSQIRFCLSTNDGTYDESLKLVSVKIKNMTSNGNCNFADGAFGWSAADTPATASYQQVFNAVFDSGTPTNWEYKENGYTKESVTYNLYTCKDDVMFLIPQTLSNCKVDITFQQGSDEPYTMEAGFSDGTWEAGKYYTYKITASKTAELTLMSVDWIDASENLSF